MLSQKSSRKLNTVYKLLFSILSAAATFQKTIVFIDFEQEGYSGSVSLLCWFLPLCFRVCEEHTHTQKMELSSGGRALVVQAFPTG